MHNPRNSQNSLRESRIIQRTDSIRHFLSILIKKCGRDIGLTTYQALFSQVTSLKDEVFRQKRGTVCGRAGQA